MDLSDQAKPILAILNLENNYRIVFTRVSARGARLILGFQTGAPIRGRCSFKGGAH